METYPMALPNPPRIRREAVESTAKVIGLTLRKNGKSDFSSWKQTHDGYRFHRWELVAKGFNRQIFLTLEDVDLFLSNYMGYNLIRKEKEDEQN